MCSLKTIIGMSRFWTAPVAGVVVWGALLFSLPSSFASAGSTCPSNEEIRAEQGTTRLPECRAYEAVTPHYKQGFPLYPKSVAPDGEKAILFSLANLDAVGAGESATEGDWYLASRSADGWQLSSMNAPLSAFVGQIGVAVEAASGEMLWEQHTPSQSALTRGLYARSASGAYRLIGQISVPFEGEETQEADYMYAVAGEHEDQPIAATPNYQHIVVRASKSNDYLPFDSTLGEVSLYEYSGTGNPPVLIGVEGEKGSTQLVSQCGTILGSVQSTHGIVGSAFNALSADGETVFFTAEPESACGGHGPKTTEVFARLHGSALSPAPAETVDVSASQCTEICGGESSKHFEGASENGRIVFLTSTQKLTNGATDGTASGDAYLGSGCSGTPQGGGGCNLYAYDFEDHSVVCQESHHCLKLVAGGEVLGVAGISQNGQRIYYVKRNGGGLPDLYVYDLTSGASTLIAHLSEEDSQMWQKEFSKPVQVTGEGGRFLLFTSATPKLTSNQEGSAEQLFEYDAVTGELERITKGETGYNNNGNGVEIGVSPSFIAEAMESLGNLTDFKTETNRLNISPNGQTVLFRTKGKLSPFAASAEKCFSVYEFHTDGNLSEGEVHLISDGQDTHQFGFRCGAIIYPAAMDASGDNLLFSSADSLVARDEDGGQRDLFDARVGGGFAPSLAGGCFGEGCASPASGMGPAPMSGGSAIQMPEVNSVSDGPVGSSSGEVSNKMNSKTKSKSRRASSRSSLRRALKACRDKPRLRRTSCERAARRKVGAR